MAIIWVELETVKRKTGVKRSKLNFVEFKTDEKKNRIKKVKMKYEWNLKQTRGKMA